jgi:uncharacterized protein (DUF736 family)
MTQENNKNNSQSDWQKRDIGALWKRSGKSQNFLSGKITIGEFGEEKEIQVVVFKNKYKEKENQPDFRIYEDTPKEDAPKKAPQSSEAGSSASETSDDGDLPDILQ